LLSPLDSWSSNRASITYAVISSFRSAISTTALSTTTWRCAAPQARSSRPDDHAHGNFRPLRGTAPRTALRPIRVANLNICQLRLANLEPKNEIRLRANNEQRQRRHYCARWSGLADNHRTLDTANVDPVSDFPSESALTLTTSKTAQDDLPRCAASLIVRRSTHSRLSNAQISTSSAACSRGRL
jgi:hypothetical protein